MTTADHIDSSTAAAKRVLSWGDQIEESLIAFFLGVMTMVTFANVIARYVFNHNLQWALETTVFLFAWLVLIGASYGVKHTFHIGVDIVVRLLSPALRRKVALVVVALCLVFTLLLLKGSWDYWWSFASKRAFYETNDIAMPDFLQWLAPLMNEGERWEKLPRFFPYAVLPISTFLLTVRFVQVGFRVWRGEQDLVVESHDVDDQLAELGGSGDTSLISGDR